MHTFYYGDETIGNSIANENIEGVQDIQMSHTTEKNRIIKELYRTKVFPKHITLQLLQNLQTVKSYIRTY